MACSSSNSTNVNTPDETKDQNRIALAREIQHDLLYKEKEPLIDVDAAGPKSQTLVFHSSVMSQQLAETLFYRDVQLSSLGNCVFFETKGYTKVEAENTVTDETWDLCGQWGSEQKTE